MSSRPNSNKRAVGLSTGIRGERVLKSDTALGGTRGPRMPGIRESVAELAYYRTAVFREQA